MSANEINIKIYKDNLLLKAIKNSVNVSGKNWEDYRKSLKAVQDNVNKYLTELVDQEQNRGEQASGDLEEDEEDSEDNKLSEYIKRKSECPSSRISKKTKT